MKYPTMAWLLQTARFKTNLSQNELAAQFGWSCGQFVSNMERGLCALPAKDFKKAVKILKIKNVELLINAYLRDEEQRIRRELI